MNTTVTKVGSPHKGFWKLSAAPKNLTPIASGAAFCLPVELHHPDANLLHTPTRRGSVCENSRREMKQGGTDPRPKARDARSGSLATA